MGAETVKWRFWVFSYNRGEFLRNCISSLESCIPPGSLISIFDDNSDDPFTVETLSELKSRHNVVNPPSAPHSEGKHGGLYRNMQAAYENSKNDDIICFIQDDMQLVRTLEHSDMLFIQNYFEKHEQSGFLQASFLKGYNRQYDSSPVRFDKSRQVYFVDRLHRSAGGHYSDTFIAKVSNLRKADWSFAIKEKYNEAQARVKFEQMAHVRDPFIAWLPFVPAYRGKRRTVALRLAEKQRKCGFYPLNTMTTEEVAALRSRDPEQKLPYAEDCLSPKGKIDLPTPWFYDPLQGNRWYKLLNKVELAVT